MGDGEGPDLSCFDFSSDRNQEAAEKSGKASDAGKTADLKQLLKSQRQEEQRLRTEAKEKKFAKSDRAARAAVDEELEASLAAMRERHAAEVAAAGGDPAGEAAGALSQLSVSGTGTGSGGGGSKKGGKTAKKGAKRDEDERQRESRMAHTKANAGPSLRELELRRLTDVLAPHRLRVYEIAADGHCARASSATARPPNDLLAPPPLSPAHGAFARRAGHRPRPRLHPFYLTAACSARTRRRAGLYRSLAHQLVDGGDETAVDFRYCRQLVLADTALASRTPLLCRARVSPRAGALTRRRPRGCRGRSFLARVFRPDATARRISQAAGYIRAHPDDFLPFLLAEHEFSDGLAGCVSGRAAETRPRSILGKAAPAAAN